MRDQFEDCLSQAHMAYAMGRYDTTLSLCAEAIKLDSSDPRVYSLQGNAYLALEKPKDAERYYRMALERDPDNGERYFELGNSFFGQEQYRNALETYAKAEQLGCRDAIKRRLYYQMGVINQTHGDTNAALINYDKADSVSGNEIDDLNAEILLNRIQIYMDTAERVNAVVPKKRRDTTDTRKTANVMMSKDYNDIMDMAENYASQLKLLIPGEFMSYHLLYQIFMKRNRFSEAEQVLLESEQACPEVSEDDFLFRKHDYALLYCYQSGFAPSAEVKRSLLMKALRSLNDIVGQVKSVEKKAEPYLTMVEIYKNLSEFHNAIKIAEGIAQYVDKWKGTPLAGYVERAQYDILVCYAQLQDYSKVREYAMLLKESKQPFYRYHAYYSEAFSAKKLAEKDPTWNGTAHLLYQKAIAYYKSCIISSPGDLFAYLYRGRAYADIGKYEKASELAKILPVEQQKTLQDYIDRCKSEQNGGRR